MEFLQPLKDLGIETDLDKGRFLIARRKFDPGDVILSSEPFAAVLDSAMVSVRCSYCFKQSGELQKCSRCKHIHYCCRQHQIADWPEHKFECKAFTNLHPRQPTATIRLMARVLNKSRDTATCASLPPGNRWDDVQALGSHWDAVPEERKVTFAQMAVVAQQVLVAGDSNRGASSPAPSPFDALHIAHMFARFQCNNHTLCDDELQSFGVGLYPLAALVNHSCAPSAVQTFHARNIVFRAAVPINPGHEITISYAEILQPRPQRQAYLRENYYFDCRCERCIAPLPPPPSAPSCTPRPLPPPDYLAQAYRCNASSCPGLLDGLPGALIQPHPDAPIAECFACATSQQMCTLQPYSAALQMALEQAQRRGDEDDIACRRIGLDQALRRAERSLHPCNVAVVNANNTLFQMCLEQQDLKVSEAHCAATVRPFTHLYNTNSPVLGLQLYKLGKLQDVLGSPAAVHTLKSAYRVLSITHGGSAALVRTLEETIHLVEATTNDPPSLA